MYEKLSFREKFLQMYAKLYCHTDSNNLTNPNCPDKKECTIFAGVKITLR